MQTSGIKIDINGSDKLLYDNSEKIEKVIKFAVQQAIANKELKSAPKNSKKRSKTGTQAACLQAFEER